MSSDLRRGLALSFSPAVLLAAAPAALDPRRVWVRADAQRAPSGPAAQRRPALHRGLGQAGQRHRLLRQRIGGLVGDGPARQPQPLEPPSHARDHASHVRGRRWRGRMEE